MISMNRGRFNNTKTYSKYYFLFLETSSENQRYNDSMGNQGKEFHKRNERKTLSNKYKEKPFWYCNNNDTPLPRDLFVSVFIYSIDILNHLRILDTKISRYKDMMKDYNW